MRDYLASDPDEKLKQVPGGRRHGCTGNIRRSTFNPIQYAAADVRFTQNRSMDWTVQGEPHAPSGYLSKLLGIRSSQSEVVRLQVADGGPNYLPADPSI